MKKLHYSWVFIALLLVVSLSCVYAADRSDWNEYKTPVVTDVKPSGSRDITVYLQAVTGTDGADKLLVELFENNSLVKKKNLGKSKNVERQTTFEMTHSGTYTIKITASRKEEASVHESELYTFDYSLPLDAPQVSAKNVGDGVLTISWGKVDEAQYYEVLIKDYDSGAFVMSETTENCEVSITDLEQNKAYSIEVSAVRNGEKSTCSPVKKTVKDEIDRTWQFTWFGQSTKETLNHYELLDSDDLTVKLYAGSRTEQGGKFTTFHDGISFYYTKIDAKNENFELTATFTVDWINPSPDGQEGFGLLILDKIGTDGVSSVNNYTNSVGLIATKFEERINNVKYSGKDVLGARFVTGITPEILGQGDSAIAENAVSETHAFSYDQSHLVKSGDVYTLTIKKDNTGYHCIFVRPEEDREWVTNEDGEYERKVYPEEFTLYGVDSLLQLDPDYLYVGFAAARWCEVTVSDVKLTVTDPTTDPPAEEKPADLVALYTKINSPSGYYTRQYPFVFTANADGTLTVKESGTNHVYIENAQVKANEDFKQTINLLSNSNSLYIVFTPDADYKPGENQVIAQFNEETQKNEENYSPATLYQDVTIREFTGSTIYVSSKGFGFNKGTKASPVDIETALKYCKPGQTIELAGGTYNLSKQLTIERGNNGTADQPKILTSASGESVTLKFVKTAQKGGIVLWGDYWIFKDFDICNTPDNVKGIQVAGNYNKLMNITAYNCGDTGIQISGSGSETFEKWPHDNLIYCCVSHDNSDSANNNADGFAAKLTCGEGNVFDSCIAYCNIDDGWDLYAKIETGPIGVVTIKNCVAYKNGSLSTGVGDGDGNGFKLGGDGISVAHVIENSIAFSNNANGITSNSNPAVKVYNCTLYGNGNRNLTLYGKSSGDRLFEVSGVLSVNGAISDDIAEMPSLASENNYLCNGNVGVNSLGERLDASVFKSVDTKNVNITFEDGKINMHGLLEQETGFGAHL